MPTCMTLYSSAARKGSPVNLFAEIITHSARYAEKVHCDIKKNERFHFAYPWGYNQMQTFQFSSFMASRLNYAPN